MGKQGVGCILIAIVGIAVAGYFLMKVTPEPEYPDGFRGVVDNYHDESPRFFGSEPMTVELRAPDFQYATIDNYVMRLSDQIGNKSVVIYFFGTYKEECLEQMMVLQAIYAERQSELMVIAISGEPVENASVIGDYITENEITFAVMHDPDREIAELYPHVGVPFIVYVDIEGDVLDWDEEVPEFLCIDLKRKFRWDIPEESTD